MSKKYTSEQFWKLYKNLPQELQDTLFAEETGNNIYEICDRNEIGDNINEIVDYVGQVLVGVLPPEDFQNTLEEDLKLKKEIAKKVAQEINRFIFYPVKPALEQLYKMEITPSEEKKETPLKVLSEEEKIREAVPLKGGTAVIEKEKPEKPEEPAGKDVYREPIE